MFLIGRRLLARGFLSDRRWLLGGVQDGKCINVFWFSRGPTHLIQKLINSKRLEQNLDRICDEMERVSYEQILQAAIRLFLRIEKNQVSFSVLQHQRLKAIMAKYPELNYEMTYYKIRNKFDQLKLDLDHSKKKEIADQMGKLFLVCFEEVQKLQVDEDSLANEVQLLQLYGDYNLNVLPKFVHPQNRTSVMETSKQAFQLTLVKLKGLLKSQQEKLREIEEQAAQSEEEKEKKKQELRVAEVYVFHLVESYACSVSKLIAIEDSLQRQLSPQRPRGRGRKSRQVGQEGQFKYPKSALLLQGEVEKALQNYKKYCSSKTVQSETYFSLKIMLLEMRYEREMRAVLDSRKPEEEQKECQQGLEAEYRRKFNQICLEGEQQLKRVEAGSIKASELSAFVLTLLDLKLTDDEICGPGTRSRRRQPDPAGLKKRVNRLLDLISDYMLREEVQVIVFAAVKNQFNIDLIQTQVKRTRSQRLRLWRRNDL